MEWNVEESLFRAQTTTPIIGESRRHTRFAKERAILQSGP